MLCCLVDSPLGIVSLEVGGTVYLSSWRNISKDFLAVLI
jgi:hypothetical protein